MGGDWTKILLAAGGAAGVAAALCYLLKEEPEGPVSRAQSAGESTAAVSKSKVEDITREQVHQILQEIIKSQELMKTYMKDLTRELLSKKLDFEQTYKRVKEVQPADPLEQYGLSMMDFDQLLNNHQADPAVREAIAKIMGAPSPSNVASEKVQAITVQKIIEVHTFMLKELEKLVDEFSSKPNKDSYDLKTVTIAAQAIVGSKVEEEFKITSEDIESAVLMYHTMLATDQDFANINIKIQQTMGKLMGSSFPPP
mmetsp:Transcript_121303/g.220641  ORF Transcript_121303/g.220641 Transcript_121303/m.220641 type:complete len:255 (+) Transcript_121303:123-887(+)